MAQKIRVELLDDLTGTAASETVTFALDGVSYEIDLSEENAAQLRDTMNPYVIAGRRTAGRAKKGRSTNPSGSGQDLEKVRAWARENGYDVKDRGRIAANIMDAYRNATA